MHLLNEYIRRASGPEYAGRPGEGTYCPILKAGVTNQILLFRGAFNPPHKGHLALLNYVFANCYKDMNILLAVILPINSRGLSKKVSSSNENDGQNALVLSRDERVKIWTGNGLPGWYWVFPGSESKWERFESNFRHDVTEAGFRLEITYLVGVDHVESYNESRANFRWQGSNIISSDVSRETRLVMGKRIQQLKNFSPWVKVPCAGGRVDPKQSSKTRPLTLHLPDCLRVGFGDIQGIVKKGEAASESFSSTNFPTSEISDDRKSSNTKKTTMIPAPRTWVCHQRYYPEISFRFVHKPDDMELLRIESTEIRQLIYKHLQKVSLQTTVPADVDRLALNGDVLWGIIMKKFGTDDGELPGGS